MKLEIAVIDLDSVMFSIGIGNKIPDDSVEGGYKKEDGRLVYIDKTEDELKTSADFFMNQILWDSGATGYIAYIKGKDTIKDRKETNIQYKANRPTEAPKWWNFVKQDLITRWKAIEAHNMEVDDLVNITRLKLPNSFIVAIDGDLLGLEGTHYQWRAKGLTAGRWVTTSKEEAETKFWTDMIAGQSGDNIKGIPGKGSKYAEQLFSANLFHEDKYAKVFKAYINHFGLDKGINEFYSNYKCLKILSDDINIDVFNIVEYVRVSKEKKEINNTNEIIM